MAYIVMAHWDLCRLEVRMDMHCRHVDTIDIAMYVASAESLVYPVFRLVYDRERSIGHVL